METENNIDENMQTWNNLPEIAKRALTIVATKQKFVTYKVNITSGNNLNDGFLSEIVRATIVGSKSTEIQESILHEFSVLCKMQVASQARRELLNTNEAFRREISLYNDYLRELVKLQYEFGIAEEQGFFNFPKCYYTEYDEVTNDGIIVMNDLRDRGFKMANKFEPLDIQLIQLVVQKLGKLHALSFVLEHKKPEIFKKYKNFNDLILKFFMETPMKEIWDTVFPLAITSIQQEHPKVAEKVKILYINLNDESQKLTNTGKHSVICHGDSWNNNFMFKLGPKGNPEQVVILDWQDSKYGSPALDFVHFLYTATDKKTRDTHYDDLLKLYHDSLSSLLENFGESADEIFPLTAFKEELKKFGKFGVIIALFNLTIVTIPVEETPNIDESMDQLMNPAKKHGGDSYLVKAIKTHYPKIATRIRDVVLDIDRFGYL